jgi:hypothetical protein
LVDTQERPVSDPAVLGKFDSIDHAVGGVVSPEQVAAVGQVVSTVGTELLTASASQSFADAQAIWLTEDTVEGRVSVENVGVHEEFVARVAGSPVSRRMAAAVRTPTVADSPTSQVVVAGQVMDARLVKTVLSGVTILQVSCWGAV